MAYVDKYIESYETQWDNGYLYMKASQDLAQCLLDLDLVDQYPQYKTLCTRMVLEGLCFKIGQCWILMIATLVSVAILVPMLVWLQDTDILHEFVIGLHA